MTRTFQRRASELEISSLRDEHEFYASQVARTIRTQKIEVFLAITLAISIVGSVLGRAYYAVPFGVVVAGIALWVEDWLALRAVEKSLPTAIVDRQASERLSSMIDWLCPAIGVEVPEYKIIGSDAFEVIVYGSRLSKPRLAVTSGVISAFDVMEFEAMITVALVKIKERSFVLSTHANWVRLISLRGPKFLVKFAWNLANKIPPEDIDLRSARTTRYPPALASAYEKILLSGANTNQEPWLNRLALVCVDPGNYLSGKVDGVDCFGRIQMLQEL